MEPLWADLINSNWRDHLGTGRREDRIGNDEWLAAFLDRAGWIGADLPDLDGRRALRDLRLVIGRIVDTLRDGRPLAAADLHRLNQTLKNAPVIRQLGVGKDRPKIILAPCGEGIDSVLGTIAAAMAQTLSEGEAERIKICANPDCGWVIYDESRNRSRRWCDASECGNLIKVRQHRHRKRMQARQNK